MNAQQHDGHDHDDGHDLPNRTAIDLTTSVNDVDDNDDGENSDNQKRKQKGKLKGKQKLKGKERGRGRRKRNITSENDDSDHRNETEDDDGENENLSDDDTIKTIKISPTILQQISQLNSLNNNENAFTTTDLNNMMHSNHHNFLIRLQNIYSNYHLHYKECMEKPSESLREHELTYGFTIAIKGHNFSKFPLNTSQLLQISMESDAETILKAAFAVHAFENEDQIPIVIENNILEKETLVEENEEIPKVINDTKKSSRKNVVSPVVTEEPPSVRKQLKRKFLDYIRHQLEEHKAMLIQAQKEEQELRDKQNALLAQQQQQSTQNEQVTINNKADPTIIDSEPIQPAPVVVVPQSQPNIAPRSSFLLALASSLNSPPADTNLSGSPTEFPTSQSSSSSISNTSKPVSSTEATPTTRSSRSGAYAFCEACTTKIESQYSRCHVCGYDPLDENDDGSTRRRRKRRPPPSERKKEEKGIVFPEEILGLIDTMSPW
jgi:hypothetical protein